VADYGEYLHAEYLPTWRLPDGRLVSADSSIDGSGLRLQSSDGHTIVCGEWAAREIGEDHPAVAEWRRATDIARRAQRQCAGVLAEILRWPQ
jgi:hypothetical protein